MNTNNRGSKILRSDEIVALLKKKIILKKILPGEALPKEELLAQKYFVSRALIREALSILKAQGYLESRRGKGGGTFVKNVAKSEEIDSLYGDLVLMGQMSIENLLAARLLIEPEAAKLAAIKGTTKDFKELAHYLDMEAQAPSLPERIGANIKFHNTIGRMSGNPFYAISIRNFMKFTYLFITSLEESTPDIHRDQEHHEIFLAIRSKDSILAFERMYAHSYGMKRKMMVLAQLFEETQRQPKTSNFFDDCEKVQKT